MTSASGSAAAGRAAVYLLDKKAGALEPRPASVRHEHQSRFKATAGSRNKQMGPVELPTEPPTLIEKFDARRSRPPSCRAFVRSPNMRYIITGVNATPQLTGTERKLEPGCAGPTFF